MIGGWRRWVMAEAVKIDSWTQPRMEEQYQKWSPKYLRKVRRREQRRRQGGGNGRGGDWSRTIMAEAMLIGTERQI
ncbi:hypothetical protein U1Q18_006190 [Sarracenia purpurea var. burkii]